MSGRFSNGCDEGGTAPPANRQSSANIPNNSNGLVDVPSKALQFTVALKPAASDLVRIVPLEQARESWNALVESHPEATLYHSAAWVEVLARAYGFRILLASAERGGKITAGCLLSPSKIPFAGRFIGLPFSDSAAPLGVDDDAVRALLDGLAGAARPNANFEIRGIAAPAPWQTGDCFRQWSIEIARPFAALERAADRNFRRQVRRAAAQAVLIESGEGEGLLRRFYNLQLETRRRLGVPPQPWRFFALVHEVFAERRAIEIWLASRDGCDLAGVVVLRERNKLYAKWSARSSQDVGGASHLVFFSMLEHYAGKAAILDLGRTDARNRGLMRFKEEMGAAAAVLPYSYFPRMPRRVSAEEPDRAGGALARVWRRLPLPFTRAIGATTYGYFA